MSDPTLVLVGALALVVLVLMVTFGRFARTRSARALLHGLGLAILIAGLWLIGFLDLVLGWLRATVTWARHLLLNNQKTLIGLGVGALGVLLMLIGTAISPVSRAEARARREARQARVDARTPQAAVGRTPSTPVAASGRTSGQSIAVTGRTTPAQPAAATSSEDDEIEAILKSHGIN